MALMCFVASASQAYYQPRKVSTNDTRTLVEDRVANGLAKFCGRV